MNYQEVFLKKINKSKKKKKKPFKFEFTGNHSAHLNSNLKALISFPTAETYTKKSFGFVDTV